MSSRPTPTEARALATCLYVLLSAAVQVAENLEHGLAERACTDVPGAYELYDLCWLEEAAGRVAVLAKVAAEQVADQRRPDQLQALAPQLLQAVQGMLPPAP